MALTEVSAFKNLSIINDDINSSAAIAGSKISPDFGSQNVSTSGNITTNGTLRVQSTFPRISLIDDDNDSDYDIRNSNGGFAITDQTNTQRRFLLNNTGNFQFGNGSVASDVDITGNLTIAGTVDGVDIAARDTLFGGLTSSSGVLTNGVTGTTQSAGDNSTKIATTAYVDNASGGGGGSLTIQEEGSSLSTAATTLNFTGIGTASGTTATKTINIPGTNLSGPSGRSGAAFAINSSTGSSYMIPLATSNYSGLSGLMGGTHVNRVDGTVDFTPATSDSVDLGSSSLLWDDVYATNGTIQTSDERLKQDIQALTTAEKTVATTLKGLIKTFKYKSAVAAKGDKARIHCGVIAQEVKAAFEAQGLKAEDYALFCYDEWDAVAEEKDEDGYITQRALPAGSRYSIRYTELLAFIISVL